MTWLDLVVVAAAALAGALGHGLGLARRLGSLAGVLAGLILAAALLPVLLGPIDDDLSAGLVRLVVVVGLAAAGVGGHWVGLRAGARVGDRHLRSRRARDRDRLAGAAAGIASVFGATWLLAPVLAAVPGVPARQARSSAVAGALGDLLPRPPDALQSLRSVVRSTPYPEVFADLQAAPDPGAPPTELPTPPDLLAAAGASVLKVQGEACGRLQRGTAFVVGSELLLTNAHVVAGELATEVVDAAGTRWPATVAAFDPALDAALLSVPGLGAPALPTASAHEGAAASVLGHPGGGDLRALAVRIDEQVDARGRDLYDERDTHRQVLVLAGALRRGDSGGPLLDEGAQVVGMAFAVAPDRPSTGYALSSTELQGFLDRPRAAPPDVGGCL